MRPYQTRSVLAAAIVALLLTSTAPVGAQDSGRRPPPVLTVAGEGVTQRLTLRDGSELIGRITAISDSTVQFESTIGTSTIAITNIIGLREERGTVRDGQYYFPNPNATRLIFAPTGRMLAPGEGYFSDYWVFFPGLSVGVSKNLSLGGGMSILPGVGFDEQIYYFT